MPTLFDWKEWRELLLTFAVWALLLWGLVSALSWLRGE